jgi:hypothetical protein
MNTEKVLYSFVNGTHLEMVRYFSFEESLCIGPVTSVNVTVTALVVDPNDPFKNSSTTLAKRVPMEVLKVRVFPQGDINKLSDQIGQIARAITGAKPEQTPDPRLFGRIAKAISRFKPIAKDLL